MARQVGDLCQKYTLVIEIRGGVLSRVA